MIILFKGYHQGKNIDSIKTGNLLKIIKNIKDFAKWATNIFQFQSFFITIIGCNI